MVALPGRNGNGHTFHTQSDNLLRKPADEGARTSGRSSRDGIQAEGPSQAGNPARKASSATRADSSVIPSGPIRDLRARERRLCTHNGPAEGGPVGALNMNNVNKRWWLALGCIRRGRGLPPPVGLREGPACSPSLAAGAPRRNGDGPPAAGSAAGGSPTQSWIPRGFVVAFPCIQAGADGGGRFPFRLMRAR